MILDPQELFATPDWLSADKVNDTLMLLESFGLNSDTIYSMAGSLAIAERAGKLPRNPSRIFEFGSGWGEGLIALDIFADSQDHEVEIVGSESGLRDRLPLRRARQVASILPHVSKVSGDGFIPLERTNDSFDVIVASMFGPSTLDWGFGGVNEDLAPRFLEAAVSSLNEGGVIIINSETDTMANVRKWTEANLPAGQAEVVGQDELPLGFQITLGLQRHVLITK